MNSSRTDGLLQIIKGYPSCNTLCNGRSFLYNYISKLLDILQYITDNLTGYAALITSVGENVFILNISLSPMDIRITPLRVHVVSLACLLLIVLKIFFMNQKRSCFNKYSLFCFFFDTVSNYTTAILCVKTRSFVRVHV